MLEHDDYVWAAQQLGCKVATVKAVAEIESKGSGFLENGQPKVLFEAHHFSKFTDGKFSKSHPAISSSYWNRSLYQGGEKEHLRLQAAISLDKDAALKSTSWGRFQMMGFNWKACGYDSLQDFINDQYSGEFGQLRAFVGFIKAMRLQKALLAIEHGDGKLFARPYNGPAFAQNEYDTRLVRAFLKYDKEERNASTAS